MLFQLDTLVPCSLVVVLCTLIQQALKSGFQPQDPAEILWPGEQLFVIPVSGTEQRIAQEKEALAQGKITKPLPLQGLTAQSPCIPYCDPLSSAYASRLL